MVKIKKFNDKKTLEEIPEPVVEPKLEEVPDIGGNRKKIKVRL